MNYLRPFEDGKTLAKAISEENSSNMNMKGIK